MNISFEYLLSLSSVKYFRIEKADAIYSEFSIIDEPNYSKNKVVYFANYSSDIRWYSNTFDRRVLLKRLVEKQKDWLYIVEDKNYLDSMINVIVIDNMDEYINQLNIKLISNINAKIIGVTGSVGKTTFCRFLEAIIPHSQCISVKRLTSLGIADFILNRLDCNTKYIIAEIGLYYANQVRYISKILKPMIGIILNVYDMHYGWNGIVDKEGILRDKYDISIYSSSFLFARQLECKNYEEYLTAMPYLPKTRVSVDWILSVEYILDCLNIHKDDKYSYIVKKISENKLCMRMHRYSINGSLVFVDSHSSIAGYFQAISDNYYYSSMLIIMSFKFDKENVHENIVKIVGTFSRYNKVIVSKSLKTYFRNMRIDNVSFAPIKNIITFIDNNNVVFIHDPEGKRFSLKFFSDGKENNNLTIAST
jgi:hypothetical protein